VEAVICSGRLSVTAMGRALRSATSARHRIKRVDRLVSNRGLQCHLLELYRCLAARVIRCQRPVLLLDWSKLAHDHWVLTAAAALDGRCVPLLSVVRSERWLGTKHAHTQFLQQLQDVLPDGCRPVLVVDAGFLTPFYQAVERLGWHYVGRLDANTRLRLQPRARWQSSRQLHELATTVAQDYPQAWLRESDPMALRLVVGKKPRRKRHSHRRSRNGSERKARRRADRPWLLVTNLESSTAEQIVGIYRLRMQIEQWFRDTKNDRFGWALRQTRCTSRLRLQVLLLLAALATCQVLLAGLQAEAQQLHRRLQASSRRHRRWLSLAYLGQLALRQGLLHSQASPPPLPIHALPA
jgi:hypothetical protein